MKHPLSSSSSSRPGMVLWQLTVGIYLVSLFCCLAGCDDTANATASNEKADYVGSEACKECHEKEWDLWKGSHHDRAMMVPSPKTMRGDFDNAELTFQGLTSKMYRDGERYMVHTEGPDGKMHDYPIKFAFGWEPLQQYLVELNRPEGKPENEHGHLQVLPLCWDTIQEKWFFLMPPDVEDRMKPDDPLHWTQLGQNWNRMCADCHSTNLKKNYNTKTQQYHTTFDEINVGCEACHGPGSEHVRLANEKTIFGGKKYENPGAVIGLNDPESDEMIETCAPCHVRRSRVVASGFRPGNKFGDFFAHAPIRRGSYHPDGQILDEVYVYGSFIQSKMYHKGIRCNDCHDPHSLQVAHKDDLNKLCTSCHMNSHPAGKYDTPSHHFHAKEGSKGALCVECHMPTSVYMGNDWRLDHSIRIPRPDLSIKQGTPNACSRCHIAPDVIPEMKPGAIDKETLEKIGIDYQRWLLAARQGNTQVRDELARVDKWCNEWCEKWYGPVAEKDWPPHYGESLTAAWQGDADAADKLVELVGDLRQPAMARASALVELRPFINSHSFAVRKAILQGMKDTDPQVRFAALGFMEELGNQVRAKESQVVELKGFIAELRTLSQQQPENTQIQNALGRAQGQIQELTVSNEKDLWKKTVDLLDDPSRLVRTEAGRVLAGVPGLAGVPRLTAPQRKARARAIDELLNTIVVDDDWAVLHNLIGLLYEHLAQDKDQKDKKREHLDAATKAYRTAVAVEPELAGPRSNLCKLLEDRADELAALNRSDEEKVLRDEVVELRRKESELLGRDVGYLPMEPDLRYRYGLSLYLIGKEKEAALELTKAHLMSPENPEILIRLALLQQKLKNWPAATEAAQSLLLLDTNNRQYRNILRGIMMESRQPPPPEEEPETKEDSTTS